MTNIEKYGFNLVREKYLDEISAKLYELSHTKSGASLIYLDRDDENKSFAIGFPTPPTDDTGVFHIIEHSVLCGSEKYPLNDPFAELLKGSLNTFLNAATYEDRTIYPVSSRCEKDFLNLVDVYMDAVFAPNLLKNPCIFHQEGWHYEYDEESNTLSRNGVVYNEMKGAYSSPDELAGIALVRALFDGTPYGKDSGGDPISIPNLTYEQLKSTHEKHYHPSGAKILLDGKMNIEVVLALLDSHLSKYSRREPISLEGRSQPRVAPLTQVRYEIAENEDEAGKARLVLGYVVSDYSDKELGIAMSVLTDMLCGSNASPIKKLLLEKGLCKDATMYVVRSRENTLVIELRDIDENRVDEITSLIEQGIRSMAEQGVDKNKIVAALNSIEFKLCERDYGTLPMGIAFAFSIFGDWMHGGLPEDALLYTETISSLRAKIDSGYFEDILMKITSDNPHRASVLMIPDKTLGEQIARKEKDELARILAEMDKEELEKIKRDQEELLSWQQAEPSEEALASLPTLAIDDIPKNITRPTAEVEKINGVKILKCPVKTNGIVYISLFFDASDVAEEELLTLSMLSSALLNFPTENHDTLSLQNDIKANLGGLFSSFTVGTRDSVSTPYLKIGASALLSKTDDLLRLIKEVLLTSKIDNADEIKNIAMQARAHIEDMILSSGEAVALSRVEAAINESGAISEYLSGYEAYRQLSEMCKDDAKIKKITTRISDFLTKLTTRERLTIGVTGDVDDEFILALTKMFPATNTVPEKKVTKPCAERNEFVLIPSKVGYAVAGGKSNEAAEYLGLMRVVRSILSYEYLWNTVRVQGGAYGTGFIPRKDGSISFYSYRDPSPARSLTAYKNSSNYLRELSKNNIDITKFIIGTIGEYDSIITPRVASVISANDYLNGRTAEDEEKTRREILSVKSNDLLKAADIIDNILSDSKIAIVGSAEHLASLDFEPSKILKI